MSGGKPLKNFKQGKDVIFFRLQKNPPGCLWRKDGSGAGWKQPTSEVIDVVPVEGVAAWLGAA